VGTREATREFLAFENLARYCAHSRATPTPAPTAPPRAATATACAPSLFWLSVISATAYTTLLTPC